MYFSVNIGANKEYKLYSHYDNKWLKIKLSFVLCVVGVLFVVAVLAGVVALGAKFDRVAQVHFILREIATRTLLDATAELKSKLHIFAT